MLDVGCGTGTFALMLADRGIDVTGLDPAAGSLDVARAKPQAESVRWILGDATRLPPLEVDAATMTGNAAQAVVDPADWMATLRAVRAALRPGGTFVFETRDPAHQAWLGWVPVASTTTTEVEGVGAVTSLYAPRRREPAAGDLPGSWRFPDGDVVSSDSTLRFRERDEVEAALSDAGFAAVHVRDAPDRPGRELVFLARRHES